MAEHEPAPLHRMQMGSLSVESMHTVQEADVLLDRAANGSDLRLRGARFNTMLAVNAASVLEKTDEQLLPSVYKYVSCSFHASPGACRQKCQTRRCFASCSLQARLTDARQTTRHLATVTPACSRQGGCDRPHAGSTS